MHRILNKSLKPCKQVHYMIQQLHISNSIAQSLSHYPRFFPLPVGMYPKRVRRRNALYDHAIQNANQEQTYDDQYHRLLRALASTGLNRGSYL